MAKINVQTDCGNAPRKVFLKELYSSLANGEKQLISDHLQDNFVWQVVGHTSFTGKEKCLNKLSIQKIWKIKELTIETLITHGTDASVSGQIISNDNTKFCFCDLIKFRGAGGTKLNSITTFLIKVSKRNTVTMTDKV
ncbi:MAG TPA: hypothetical protein PLN13_11580 [Bacteroidia bacterium]|nr:hypothetical protein [Bacteroidia bacterium]HRH09214.1 hypothetical protein [Bacteroidia bacterium]